ncbi:hypothetical protein LOK49_LG10G00298 [Camellia lanceoleosa]|uniref:Uncharacterized protein n=1 Tax=Camellia lanceoleosa TaxID=1840588 RepID=A0ACC0G924_9ERIC|nr:hypothetical protein LOK49_LG10G00298 [Camellia lanceoleosa]
MDLEMKSSIFVSSSAMNFDYHALEGYDLVLYSDFSLVDVMEDTDNDNYFAPAANNFSATRCKLTYLPELEHYRNRGIIEAKTPALQQSLMATHIPINSCRGRCWMS